jgi:hypothetical protein
VKSNYTTTHTKSTSKAPPLFTSTPPEIILHRDIEVAATCILVDWPEGAAMAEAIRGRHDIILLRHPRFPSFFNYDDRGFARDLWCYLTAYISVVGVFQDPFLKQSAALMTCITRHLNLAVTDPAKLARAAKNGKVDYPSLLAVSQPWTITCPSYRLWRAQLRQARATA